jgi:hypothetical protein
VLRAIRYIQSSDELVATGSIHSFDTMHRLRWMPVEYTSMIETFRYIPSGSCLARPEPPRDLIPMPVFASAGPVVDDEPEPVQAAILQVLNRIEREIRALRAQEVSQNALAVPLESAMAMIGCKRSQVFKLLEQGRLERAPKVGRTVMITVASIEALLAKGALPKGGTRSRTKATRAGARKTTPAPVGPSPALEPRALGAAILKLPL